MNEPKHLEERPIAGRRLAKLYIGITFPGSSGCPAERLGAGTARKRWHGSPFTSTNLLERVDNLGYRVLVYRASPDFHAVRTSLSGPRYGPWMAAFVAAGVAITTSLLHSTLGDTDPYRHIEYARLLWQSGFALRGHPFLPFTLLGETKTDLWLGFHWFCIPFSSLGLIWGGRIAGAAVAAVSIGSTAWLFQRLGQRRGWMFALAPLALSQYFQCRDCIARPAHLTIPLVLVSLAAGAGALGPAAAGVAAFIYGLLHLSSPLSVFFVLVGIAAALCSDRTLRVRPLVWSIGGLALALLIRPDRATYLGVAWVTLIGALGVGRAPHLFQADLELYPIQLRSLLEMTAVSIILLAIILVFSRRRRTVGEPSIRIAVLVALGIVALFCLRTARFADYLIPLFCMAMAMWAPFDPPQNRKVSIGVFSLALAGLVATAFNVRESAAGGDEYVAPPATYEAFAADLRKVVPPGRVLVTDDVMLTSVLWAYAPEYRYIAAYDPSTLYDAFPKKFWRWANMVEHGIDCDSAECRPSPPSATAIANVIHSFGTPYFVSFYVRPGYSVLTTMKDSPDRFELDALQRGRPLKLSLWRVKPSSDDEPWTQISDPPTWMATR